MKNCIVSWVPNSIDIAQDPRVVGIGECGLDFHYDLSPRDVQAKVFRAHCEAARETGLPLVVRVWQRVTETARVLVTPA